MEPYHHPHWKKTDYAESYQSFSSNGHYRKPHHYGSSPTNHFYSGSSMIKCANCGEYGHVHRACTQPTTSYGIVCARWRPPSADEAWYGEESGRCIEDSTHKVNDCPEYLLVQRKDSLSFVEFMRGKYDLHNRDYLCMLFTNMTEEERDAISTQSFDQLWKNLWCKTEEGNDGRNFNREYQDSKYKFQKLSDPTNDPTMTIPGLMNDTRSVRAEAEWGFPKGRRNVNEGDLECALREFEEETGYDPAEAIHVLKDVAPFCEEFTGTNNKKYRHIYYVALWNHAIPRANAIHSHNPPCHEIRSVRWFGYESAQTMITDENPTRKRVLQTINNMLHHRQESPLSSSDE